MSPLDQVRRDQTTDFARQLEIDPDGLYNATLAVWSNLNPQVTTFARAMSIAGVALRAAMALSEPATDHEGRDGTEIYTRS